MYVLPKTYLKNIPKIFQEYFKNILKIFMQNSQALNKMSSLLIASFAFVCFSV
jgi:hypothetical protein